MHLSWQQLFLEDLVALKVLQVISESWPYTPRDVPGGGRELLADKRCIWLRNQKQIQTVATKSWNKFYSKEV